MDAGCTRGGACIYLQVRTAVVGETYVLTTKAKQHFTYSVGQSSTFSFGVSTSGIYGSFEFNGSYSWNETIATPWPWYGANRSEWYTTQFHWGEYKCVNREDQIVEYGQAPYEYVGGANIRKPTFIPKTPHRFCAKYIKGTAPTSTTGSAVTWTVKLAPAAVIADDGLGFDADIQTGFDKSAVVGYKMEATRWLCGWKDFPGGVPKQLVVHRSG